MEFWQAIKNLEGQTLKTLDRRFPFDVLDISENIVIVKPHRTNKERIILWRELEGAYIELLALGQISRSKIEARHSPRNPVYVAALLAELKSVTYTIRPIVLRLQNRDL